MSETQGQFRMLVITLCGIILCVRAHRNDRAYRQIYGILPATWLNSFSPSTGDEDYLAHLLQAIHREEEKICQAVTFQSKSSFVLLDSCDILQTVCLQCLEELSCKKCKYYGYPLEWRESLQMIYQIQEKYRNDTFKTFMFSLDPPCSTYILHNASLAEDSLGNATMFRQRSCPWNIRHLMKDVLDPYDSIINIRLEGVPILDLLKEGLVFFPNLRELVLRLSSESFDEDLLCYSPYLKVFSFTQSMGYLRKFPSHIFNCSEELNITIISLIYHHIPHLPANAFQSAARSLKYLFLQNVGLGTIHKDAFSGVMGLEAFYLLGNIITSPIHYKIPPSAELKQLCFDNKQTDGSVDLDVLKLYEQKHLVTFEITWTSSLKGKFCSLESQSNLKLLTVSAGQLTSLAPPLIDNCVSLKYLMLQNNALEFLDVALLANVSLEALDASQNKLTYNVSWSGLLAHQHELLYLNLSWNNLMSWTQNIGAVWQLKQLDISHNNIANINRVAFENLTRLELLSLEGNKLHESDFLCEISAFLHAINLAGNLLNSVECLHRMTKGLLHGYEWGLRFGGLELRFG